MTHAPQSPRPARAFAAREAILSCSGWNSRLAARRIAKFLERRMEGCGLTLTQFALTAQIAAAEDDTVGGLSESMELDQSTLSRNLRGLEAAGLVEIAIAEEDQRRRAVWLTETGARLLQKAIPVWRKAHAALAQRVDPRLALRLGAASEELVDK